jgi:HNH endonuclease
MSTTREIGRCIYCRRDDVPLSDEHIIPFGLGGQEVLGHASCSECATRTSAVERRVLRDMLLPARTVMGAPTRRKNERPTAFDADVRIGGRWSVKSVGVDSYVAPMAFPLMPLPAAIGGPPAEAGMISLFGHDETAVMKRRADGLVDPARRAEAEVVVVRGKLFPAMFARLIAKIGFGYAVWWLGLDLIEPTIVDTVLHKGTAINEWVGGSANLSQMEPAADEQHAVRTWVAPDGVILAQVCLFADAGAPQYIAVVGRYLGALAAATP